MPRTLRLLLSYDGTEFVGWQRQAAGASVQGLLEEALAAIEGAPVTVTGAGRTDAGVHAIGQVASCRLKHAIPTDALVRALNARLPGAIRVRAAGEVPEAFHARYSAVGKTYRYVIFNGRLVSPFERRYVWAIPLPLDLEAMRQAARALEGEHDFAALQGAGSETRGTTRTVHAASIRAATSVELFGPVLGEGGRPGGERYLVFEMAGNGFLRHMVRNAVGSLVEVGSGRREPSWLATLIASGDRTKAGPTAPAAGLFLVRVAYGDEAVPLLAPPPGTL